jgi:uncharacterized protein YndB with AHSA1/START domain
MQHIQIPTSAAADTTPQLRVVVHAVLPREPEAVFDYLARLENNPEWNWAVTSILALTDGPPRQGSLYLQGSAGGDGTTLELTQIEPPDLLVVRSAGAEFSATYRYRLSAASSDATLVSLEVTVSPSHPVGLTELYLQRIRVALRSSLDNLGEAVTQRKSL